MKLQTIYNELAEVAKEHNIEIRKENGSFRGGYCTLNERNVIILNKKMPLESMVVVLAEALSVLDLNSVYLKPATRDFISR